MKFPFQKIAIVSYSLLLVSCEHAPQERQQPVVQPQTFVPETVSGGYNAPPSASRAKYNVPSAPLSTPLCGTSLQEQAQTGQKIYAQSVMSGNNCALNACFQPLTGTYISQTGNPVVCR